MVPEATTGVPDERVLVALRTVSAELTAPVIDEAAVWRGIRSGRHASARRLVLATPIAAALAVVVVLAPGLDFKTGPQESGLSGPQNVDQQELLALWLERVRSSAGEDEDFGGLALTYDPATIQLSWRGQPSASVQQVLDDARDAGIEVRIIRVVYGIAELEDATLALAVALADAGIEVVSVRPAETLAGLVVELADSSGDPEAPAEILDIARGTIGEIPVSLSFGIEPIQHNDSVAPGLAKP